MSKLASNVTNSVTKGETLANQTTESMNEIDKEVNSINEAITVIDQIAFQTNILSLNAAVKAATDGEAGKGFAVVAQDVRNLATRSAEAANEIKRIVQLATSKTKEGSEIANSMIEGYTSLNENISITLDLIQNVTTASKEQSVGMVQINDAVNNLDQITQRNAQSASESNEIIEKVNSKEFDGK